MKNLNLILLLLLISSATMAQRNPQTLVGEGVEFVSGFGSFDVSFSSLGDEMVNMTGGSGALLINNQFYIGGYGMGMTNDVRINYDDPDFGSVPYFAQYSHGGLMLGFIINPEGLIHFGISSKVGWGSLYISRHNYFPGDDILPSTVNDDLFIAIPRGEVELNVTNWCKLNFGVGYQFTNGVDNVFYKKDDLTGMNYELSFMFGWFR
jgi:hypothetical protein